MTQKDFESFADISLGDEVIVTKESGFQGGIPVRRKVARIVVTEWTAEEASRIRMPTTEVTWRFADGSTAGCFDSVRKADPAAAEVPPPYPGCPFPGCQGKPRLAANGKWWECNSGEPHFIWATASATTG